MMIQDTIYFKVAFVIPGGNHAAIRILNGKQGSTGIGNGIAIPHGKLEEDTLRAVGVFVQLETPIAFDAIDNQPVDLLFALLVPADQTKTHLHTLSLVAKRLADKAICRRLRAAQSDEELYQIITDTEGTPDEA